MRARRTHAAPPPGLPRAFTPAEAAAAEARLAAALASAAKPLRWYRRGRVVRASDPMAPRGYPRRFTYVLAEAPGAVTAGCPPGARFTRADRPWSPARMLRAGVFEGRYLNDCYREFPREWYRDALRRGRLAPGRGRAPSPRRNAFRTRSRLPLSAWRRNGWVPPTDGEPRDRDYRGWFQWWCRFWLGRRGPTDSRQIRRWFSFRRHRGAVIASARRLGRAAPATPAEKRRHRPRQRQALLQWGYDPYV